MSEGLERAGDLFTQALRDGDLASVDVAALCRAHPEIEPDLLRLQAACRLVHDVLGNSAARRRMARDDGLATVPATGDTPWRSAVEFAERLAGRRVGGARYRAEGELGRGGMGVVNRVWDDDLQRSLAMKVARTRGGGALEPELLVRFLEEARITGRLEHPGIVPVHEVGVGDDGAPYFTMKLVRGRTLQDVIREGPPAWTTARLVGVLLKICEAMGYAHSKGVVHRDLKPSNIMVGRFGEVFVMDWGLARALDGETQTLSAADGGATSWLDSPLRDGSTQLTRDGDIVGTPAYMSPEQAAGRVAAIGRATDVYSLGAMLYHVLAGHPPYLPPGRRVDARTLLEEVRQGPPEPVARAAKHVAEELVTLCEIAMTRDPEQRVLSMEALGEQLRAWLEGRVVSVHERGPWIEFKKWCARNRATSAALGALVVVLAASGFALAWKEAERRHESELRQDDLQRQVDARIGERLVEEADELWPAHPSRIPAMEDWLARARAFVAEHADADEQLEQVRLRGEQGEGLADVDLELLDEHVEENDKYVAEERDALEQLDLSPSRRATALEVIDVLGSRGTRLRAELEARSSELEYEEPWRFADPRDAIEHDGLAAVGLSVVRLGRRGGCIEQVEQRVRDVRQAFGGDEVRDEAWRAAIASIARVSECPHYGGMAISPQEGLFPLRRNPSTSLWEFWHELSGTRPQRDASGRWIVRGDTGIILVLMPGGSEVVGVQRDDPLGSRYVPNARENDVGVRQVRISPYFIGAHELTQAQYGRLTNEYPSRTREGTLLMVGGVATPRIRSSNPVEMVSYLEVAEALARWGLDIPSEVQWESAARGAPWVGPIVNLDTAFPDEADYRAALNGLEQCLEAGACASSLDVFPGHAPVGSFPPNRAGLYDVQGNVSEWCKDWFSSGLADPIFERILPETAEIRPRERFERSWRGSSFRTRLEDAVQWVTIRHGLRAEQRSDDLGVRVARRLDR